MEKRKSITVLTVKEVSPLLEQAKIIEIKDEVSLEQATEFLSNLNAKLDQVVDSRETITKPLNEALKQARLKYKPIESALESSIDIIRDKMSAYATEIDKERKKQEQKIQDKLENGNMSIPTALKKLETLDSVPSTVSSNSGSVSFRPVEKLKIVNPLLVPRQYLTINEKAVLDDLKNGVKVAGCEIEIIQVAVNRR